MQTIINLNDLKSENNKKFRCYWFVYCEFSLVKMVHSASNGKTSTKMEMAAPSL